MKSKKIFEMWTEDAIASSNPYISAVEGLVRALDSMVIIGNIDDIQVLKRLKEKERSVFNAVKQARLRFNKLMEEVSKLQEILKIEGIPYEEYKKYPMDEYRIYLRVLLVVHEETKHIDQINADIEELKDNLNEVPEANIENPPEKPRSVQSDWLRYRENLEKYHAVLVERNNEENSVSVPSIDTLRQKDIKNLNAEARRLANKLHKKNLWYAKVEKRRLSEKELMVYVKHLKLLDELYTKKEYIDLIQKEIPEQYHDLPVFDLFHNWKDTKEVQKTLEELNHYEEYLKALSEYQEGIKDTKKRITEVRGEIKPMEKLLQKRKVKIVPMLLYQPHKASVEGEGDWVHRVEIEEKHLSGLEEYLKTLEDHRDYIKGTFDDVMAGDEWRKFSFPHEKEDVITPMTF